MNSATNKFLNKLTELKLIKENPTLWLHINQENTNLNDATIRPKQVQCELCFTPKQPKLIIKSRKNSKTKKNNKKVFIFCKICGHKMPEICGELKRAEKLKIPIQQMKIAETITKVESNPKNAESLSSKEKKKKKKKDSSAGLIIPLSLLKAGSNNVFD